VTHAAIGYTQLIYYLLYFLIIFIVLLNVYSPSKEMEYWYDQWPCLSVW